MDWDQYNTIFDPEFLKYDIYDTDRIARLLEIHRSAEGIIGMREVTISCSILGCAVIVLEFSTKLGNSSQSSVNIPGAPPEVTQRLVILTMVVPKCCSSSLSMYGYPYSPSRYQLPSY